MVLSQDETEGRAKAVRSEAEVGARLERQLEQECKLGEKLINNLPSDFKDKNKGKFIAITYGNEILAVRDSLLELNEELCRIKPDRNYYLARIGHSSICKLGSGGGEG